MNSVCGSDKAPQPHSKIGLIKHEFKDVLSEQHHVQVGVWQVWTSRFRQRRYGTLVLVKELSIEEVAQSRFPCSSAIAR